MIDYSISKATEADYEEVSSLLKKVNLPIEGVKEHFQDFIVLKDKDLAKDHRVLGCVGLEVYKDKALLRSLAITPKLQSQGLGGLLTDSILDYARTLGIHKLYLLTNTAERFFEKKGFMKITRESVPIEIQQSIEFKKLCPQSATCLEYFLF